MKVMVYDKYDGALYTGLTTDMLARVNDEFPTLDDMHTLLSKADRFETQVFCVIREKD